MWKWSRKERKKSANAISALLTKLSPKKSENTHTRKDCNHEKVISEWSLDLSLQQTLGTDSYMEGGGGRGFKRNWIEILMIWWLSLVARQGWCATMFPVTIETNILTTCLMNTTLRTRQIRGTQTKTLPATDFVEGDAIRLISESFQINDPNFGAEGWWRDMAESL